MKIELDQKRLNETTARAVNEAVEEAIGGFAVKQALSEAVAASLAEQGITTALAVSLRDKIDIASITTAIATQFAKTIVTAAVLTLNESVVETIVKLRSGSYISTENENKLRTKVRAELKREATS